MSINTAAVHTNVSAVSSDLDNAFGECSVLLLIEMIAKSTKKDSQTFASYRVDVNMEESCSEENNCHIITLQVADMIGTGVNISGLSCRYMIIVHDSNTFQCPAVRNGDKIMNHKFPFKLPICSK